MKGVFDVNLGSIYDDRPEERYHFPTRRNYMEVAEASLHDWVLYRESRRNGGRQAYVAAARVNAIIPDPDRPGFAYAYVGDYLPFDPPVSFRSADHGYWETPLRAVVRPSDVGRELQGRSMRLISDSDFAAVVAAGLGETLIPENVIRYGDGIAEAPLRVDTGYQEPQFDFVRRIEQTLLNRKVRDANFRRIVCQAYDDTCAVTGLRIVNGGGRSEVQAAHIWPVEHGGPDVVQNGIALSGTIHWLFDRHLISITDDYRLLVSHNKVPAELRGLFDRQLNRIRLPRDEARWPHPTYLARHQEAFMAV